MTEALNESRSPDTTRDPIDWAIVGVILAGCSLVLALEQKIEARRSAESEEAARKAQGGNLPRLRAIREHIDEIHKYLSDIKNYGKIVFHPDKSGIARSSLVFSSAEDEERFNQSFDRITALIARINRCLSEIDPIGIPLNVNDVRKFVAEPIKHIQQATERVLRADMGPYDRMGSVDSLLTDFSSFVGNLEGVFGKR